VADGIFGETERYQFMKMHLSSLRRALHWTQYAAYAIGTAGMLIGVWIFSTNPNARTWTGFFLTFGVSLYVVLCGVRLRRRYGKFRTRTASSYDKKVEDTFLRLHRSIKRGDLTTIRHELDSGVSPNFENRFGFTMLMLAASEGNAAIGQLLISRDADTNRATTSGPSQSAMSLCVVGGHVRFLKMLLDHGANADSPLNGTSAENWVPISRANPETRNAILSLLRTHRANKPKTKNNEDRNGPKP